MLIVSNAFFVNFESDLKCKLTKIVVSRGLQLFIRPHPVLITVTGLPKYCNFVSRVSSYSSTSDPL